MLVKHIYLINCSFFKTGTQLVILIPIMHMCYEHYLVALQMLEMLVATSMMLVVLVWHLHSPCLQSLDQKHHHKWLRDLLSWQLHRQDLCTLWTVKSIRYLERESSRNKHRLLGVVVQCINHSPISQETRVRLQVETMLCHKWLEKQWIKAALICVSKVAPPSGHSWTTKPRAKTIVSLHNLPYQW